MGGEQQASDTFLLTLNFYLFIARLSDERSQINVPKVAIPSSGREYNGWVDRSNIPAIELNPVKQR